MNIHSKFSPSSAHRWVRCPGSLTLEAALPQITSAYAEEGTLAHDYCSACLEHKPAPEIPEEMIENAQVYLDYVRNAAAGKIMLVEQRVYFSEAIGVPDQSGTADALIFDQETQSIELVDLKYGMGHRVLAESNEQLLTYLIGAIETYGPMFGPFTNFKLTIVQPRLDHIDSWEPIQADIDGHIGAMRSAADIHHRMGVALNPSENACRFCRAKATCPALTAKVAETVFDDFEALDNPDAIVTNGAPNPPPTTKLGEVFGVLDLIEDWCRAVRSETERRIFAGEQIIGPDGVPMKLIEGRKGFRTWTDEGQAESMLLGILPPDKVYQPKKVITASAAAKILDKKKTAAHWEQFKTIITQAPGKPKVALGSAPGEPYRGELSADEFEDVTAQE